MNRKSKLLLFVLFLTACKGQDSGKVLTIVTASQVKIQAPLVSSPTSALETTTRTPGSVPSEIPSPPKQTQAAIPPAVTRAVILDGLPLATRTPWRSPTASTTPTNAPVTLGPCPVGDPRLKPDFNDAFAERGAYVHLYEPVMEFLNTGGTVQAVIDALRVYEPEFYQNYIFERDLTGDGIQEVILGGVWLFVLGCENGQYINIGWDLHLESDFGADQIHTVLDMNLDGVPEVVLYNWSTAGFIGRSSGASIFEWNGKGFQNIIRNDHGGMIDMGGLFTVDVMDVDANGTFELVAEGGVPGDKIYVEGIPWRLHLDTYMWDGSAFSLSTTEFAPPEYRYQAVQDGDRMFLLQEYDRALGYYQQAIFDDQLIWWSGERKEYERTNMETGYFDPTPTPGPYPTPDPLEFPYLAAYARFRIFLLHITRGWLSDAQVVYNTLLAKFPVGQPGHVFAEMAEAFWMTYQDSKNIPQACEQAVGFAEDHPDILKYLGSEIHGWQDRIYTPEDVCPVK